MPRGDDDRPIRRSTIPRPDHGRPDAADLFGGGSRNPSGPAACAAQTGRTHDRTSHHHRLFARPLALRGRPHMVRGSTKLLRRLVDGRAKPAKAYSWLYRTRQHNQISQPHSRGLDPSIFEAPETCGSSPRVTIGRRWLRLLRCHRRRGVADREAAIAGGDVRRRAVRDAAFEDLLRQRVLQLALDHPL